MSCTNLSPHYSTKVSGGDLEIVGKSGWSISSTETRGPNPIVDVNSKSGTTVFIDFTKQGELKRITVMDMRYPLDRKTLRFFVSEGSVPRGDKFAVVQILPLGNAP